MQEPSFICCQDLKDVFEDGISELKIHVDVLNVSQKVMFLFVKHAKTSTSILSSETPRKLY